MENAQKSRIPGLDNLDAGKEETGLFGLTKEQFVSILMTSVAVVKDATPAEREKIFAVITGVADLAATKMVTDDIAKTASFYRHLYEIRSIPEHVFQEYGTALAKDANMLLGVRSNAHQVIKNNLLATIAEFFKRAEKPKEFPDLEAKLAERAAAARAEKPKEFPDLEAKLAERAAAARAESLSAQDLFEEGQARRDAELLFAAAREKKIMAETVYEKQVRLQKEESEKEEMERANSDYVALAKDGRI